MKFKTSARGFEYCYYESDIRKVRSVKNKSPYFTNNWLFGCLNADFSAKISVFLVLKNRFIISFFLPFRVPAPL